ncbi:ferritin-like domain-containing protein [Estrella lausannensis]|uniref:Uncharacterized protein n=1 Tax=Estrella lausannensis TaxID=483423 RepID=A0A0H5DSJ7_9BACT|nr:ferritin-like domain-containing protein [Estrella lausannensis]CRX39278.1 Conserved hypothetical protein [Estrella lausannensis]
MEKTFKSLLINELSDLLSAERQIVEAMPEMIRASESPDLKHALESHLVETKTHVERLEKIFDILNVKREEKFCPAMKGLIEECKSVLHDFRSKSSLCDVLIISKAQRITHYGIAAYGTARTFAREMELGKVADLLQASLDEEGNADKKLTKIAEGGLLKSGINQQAKALTAQR